MTLTLTYIRCGNIAAILELDEHLNKNFKVREELYIYMMKIFQLRHAAVFGGGGHMCKVLMCETHWCPDGITRGACYGGGHACCVYVLSLQLWMVWQCV